MFFYIITKNLNWEILTKHLVTFKRWDGVKDEKILYYRGSLKNPIFMEGSHENTIYRGELIKKCESGHKFKRGLVKKRGWCLWGRLIPQCTLW